MLQIKSMALYPATGDPLLPSDPPKGCALAARVRQGWDGKQYPVDDPWPVAEVGQDQELEIQTENHWIWSATLEEIRDADHWVVRIVGQRRPMPLPSVQAAKDGTFRVILPNMSGDAWCTDPRKGVVLTIGGQAYKATHKPRPVGLDYEYRLAPVSADMAAKRTGRVRITDLTDPNPDSYRYYGHNVGRVIQVGDEWLHVEKVQRQPYGSGEGDEIFGYNTIGVGHFVPAEKAAKLDAAWQAKKKVRGLELELRVACQDVDYGGNPDAVPGLEARLAEARQAAGME